MADKDELQLILQITRLYYEQDLTQQEIAERLNLTRQKVSRLLVQARSEGIVRITIHDPTPVDTRLALELKQTFGLKDVVLTSGEGLANETLRATIGMTAARYLVKLLKDDSLIGIGWGRTLFEMVNSFPAQSKIKLHIIPLIGGIGGMAPSFQVNEIARRFADSFDGVYRFIHAPAFTQDTDVWKALMKMAEIKEIQELWQRLDLAVVGIGHVEFQKMSSMFFVDYISPSSLAQLEARGAVGDICGHFFNIHGKPIAIESEVIGISLPQLEATSNVVAVVGGKEKARAILGALRGGYVKVLVSDTVTAQAVLQENAVS
ncbi:MAG: sugar-binding transcriptional regulator [Anaerolineae bacterium]|nr:sugar-binding transcriptional regulator [Anaerolineae bacterium]